MIDVPNYAEYIKLPRDNLLSTLATVLRDLCGLIQEVSLAEATELSQRIDGWQHSRDNTKHGQEMAGTIQSAAAKQALIDRRADLAIKTEEKWFLLRLLDGDTNNSSRKSS